MYINNQPIEYNFVFLDVLEVFHSCFDFDKVYRIWVNSGNTLRSMVSITT